MLRDLTLIAFVFAMLPICVARPAVGVVMWCWISYMNPHRLSWGPAFDMPFAMLIAVATLAGWLFSREPKRIPVTPITFFLLAFAVWTSLTTVFALVPQEANPRWIQSSKMFLMTFVTIAIMQSQQRLHALIWAIMLSHAFFGVKGGAFTLLTGGENRVWGPAGSFIEDNNALALALLVSLPLIRYLQQHSASRLVRWGLGGAIVLTGLAIIGTHSRGAFLGGVAIALCFLMKTRHRIKSGVAILVLGVAALAFVPDQWTERMETIKTYDEDESARGRIDAWTYAVRLALDRPLVGGGFLSYHDAERFLRYVPEAPVTRAYHSIYFEVLGDHGFVGLALFLSLALCCWITLSRIMRRTRGRPEFVHLYDLSGALQISLIGYAVAGAFQNLAFYDLLYHLVAITVIAERQSRAAITTETVRTAGRSPEPLRPALAR